MQVQARDAMESKGSPMSGSTRAVASPSPKNCPQKVFIDVNCTQFDYSSPVSSFVEHALTLEEQRRRGYRNEKERMQKLRRLAPGLDDLNLMMNICSFYGGIGMSSRGNTANGRTYPLLEERCKIDQRSHNYTWWNPLSNPLPEVPSDRSETPEEAMQSSLLSLVEPSYVGNLAELDELFCRDTEPFSELFEVALKRIYLNIFLFFVLI